MDFMMHHGEVDLVEIFIHIMVAMDVLICQEVKYPNFMIWLKLVLQYMFINLIDFYLKSLFFML